MKKLHLLIFITFLSSCTTFTNIRKVDTPKFEDTQSKATMDYNIYFYENGVSRNQAYYDNNNRENLAENNYFTSVSTNMNPDYTLKLEIYGHTRESNLCAVVSIVTITLVPCKMLTYTDEIKSTLTNNKTKEKVELPVKIINGTTWNWLLTLFLAPLPNASAGNFFSSKYVDDIYKNAAYVAYNSDKNKSKRVKEILNSKTVSSDDVEFSAKYANSFNDFITIREKMSGEINSCQVMYNLLFVNKNQILSKSPKSYWTGLDYYKMNCLRNKIIAKDDMRLGITKKDLIEMLGNPPKIVKENNDTETLTYDRSYINFTNVKRSDEIYTVDKGIVTKVTNI